MERITVNGARINCIDEGRGATILLLHGLGGSRDDWRLQRSEFAARHRVIIPDLRGFGASERREPFTIRQHARDMIALLAARGVARAHVVGISMGGAVAIEMALLAPGSVATLVLANTAPGFILTNWQRRRMAWLRVVVATFLGVGAVARLYGQRMFPARHQGRLRRRLIRRASNTSRWVYLATLRALTRWNAASRMASIRAPTLVLGAEHDFTTSGEKRRWAALIPEARFVEIPGSHHHSELDSPVRFNREVLDFVKRHLD
ncbi:MAG: alpha/beta fold hydrolase [Steroidobacteraceae bacterium]